MNIKKLVDIKAKQANIILKDFLPIPENAVTLLSAKGGTGKTRLSLIVADRYARENKRDVALWLTEDYEGQVRHIFDEMIKDRMVQSSSLDRMHLILDNPPQLAKRDQGVFKANYDEIKMIGDNLIDLNIGLAVFDPLLAFYGGNENDNSEARVFIQTFATWANSAKITTLIIHHANKDGNSRGATAFHDGVRARYEMSYCLKEDGEVNEDIKKQGIRNLTIKKDNWGISIPFHALTDGEDSIGIKIAPATRTFMSEAPIINEFNNNSFLGEIV